MVMDASVSHYRSVLGCCNKQPEVQVGDIPIFDTVQRIQRVSMPTYQSGPQQRNNFLTSLSYLTGAHDLKIGYQYMLIWNRRLDVSYSHFPAGLEILTRNDVPSAVRTYNTPTTNNNRAADHAIYFQDRWTPHRKWTLNLGVRVESTYGRQFHEDGFVCQATTIFIQGQCFAASEGVPDFLDVAPRLSAIYDVTGDGRTALKFTANRYMIPIGSDYLSLVNPLAGDVGYARVDRCQRRLRPAIGRVGDRRRGSTWGRPTGSPTISSGRIRWSIPSPSSASSSGALSPTWRTTIAACTGISDPET